MRSIIALFSLMLSVLGASAQCVELVTPKAEAITTRMKGYVPVAVYLKISVPNGDAHAEARKSFYQFWIAGSYPALRRDREFNIQTVWQCASLGKTYVRVRSGVDDDQTTDHSYVLRSATLLPSQVVRDRPQVGTTLESETSYTGKWGSSVLKNGRKTVTLTFEERN